MRLEALAAAHGPVGPSLPIGRHRGGDGLVLDTVGLVSALVEQRRLGRPAGELAAMFHESLAQGITAMCVDLAAELKLDRICLSGGVFQNALLLARVEDLLRNRDLRVFANQQVPANDGGISLGQALVAASRGSEARLT